MASRATSSHTRCAAKGCAAPATVMRLARDMRRCVSDLTFRRVNKLRSRLGSSFAHRPDRLRHSEAIASGSKDCSQVRVLRGDVAIECVRRGVRLANCALLGRDAACTHDRHSPGHRQKRDVLSRTRGVCSRRAAFGRGRSRDRGTGSGPERDHGWGRRVPVRVAGRSVPLTVVKIELRNAR